MPFVSCGVGGFYFCHVPRTAGRAMLSALAQSGCRIDYTIPRGSHPHPYKREWMFQFKDAPSIAVVREPIDRFISAMSFEDRCESKEDLFQKVRMFRRLPSTDERHFDPQVGFINEDTRLYSFENGLHDLEADLRAFGFLKPNVKLSKFNAGGRHLDVTPTERRIHLEKMKRFYRQDIALWVKAKEQEKQRGQGLSLAPGVARKI